MARLQARDKLAPGEVPEGMQKPLPPVRLVFSLPDGSGQPVPGFDRGAFNLAKMAAESNKAAAGAFKKRRGEAARLGLRSRWGSTAPGAGGIREWGCAAACSWACQVLSFGLLTDRNEGEG